MSPLEQIANFADVPVQIEAELDRTIMKVRDILNLSEGKVLRMSRSAGENIDILVGGSLVGFGEIVVLEDIMGVRITDFNEAQ